MYGGGLNPWSSVWGSQWINPLYNPYSLYLGGWPYTQGLTGLPQLPATQQDDTGSITPPIPEPPAQSGQDKKPGGFSAEKTSWSARPHRINPRRGSGHVVRNPGYQKLNGLWVDDNGEMLGIRGNRFLWYSNSRYAKGQLAKSPTTIEARIMETRTVVRFQYRLHGNEMIIMSRDGRTRTFNRMPLIEPQRVAARPPAAYLRYDTDAGNLHVRHSSYRSGAETPVIAYPHFRSRSDRLPAAQRSDSRTFTPLKASYSPGTGVRSSTVSYRLDAGRSRSAPAPRSTEPGDAQHANNPALSGLAVAKDAADALATMDLKPGIPAAPATRAEGDGDIEPEAAADAQPDTEAGPSKVTDSNDPYNYLFSYVRDGDSPGSADQPGNHASNIWQPNQLFPHRRGDRAAPEAGEPAGTRVSGATTQKNFVWTQRRPWDW